MGGARDRRGSLKGSEMQWRGCAVRAERMDAGLKGAVLMGKPWGDGDSSKVHASPFGVTVDPLVDELADNWCALSERARLAGLG